MTHRVVIVGGGAGGLELATRLGRTLGRKGQAQITLLDMRMTHLWKPLLHEIACGALDASEDELNYLAQASWNHFEFQLGRFSGIDRSAKYVEIEPLYGPDGEVLAESRRLPYDTLVLAVGSRTNDFGTPGAKDHCLFLDSPDEAIAFHQRMLRQYVGAQARGEVAHRLEIAIVGGGATGVELAAELRNASAQLAAYGLDNIAPGNLQVTLVEAGPRLLPALPEYVGTLVQQMLTRMGVRVLCGSAVRHVDAEGMQLADGSHVRAQLKVWAAGIKVPEYMAGIGGLESNRLNQLVVRSTLQTTLDDAVFALGDCAACPLEGSDGRTVPPRAQAAHQQAELLAISIAKRIQGKSPLPAYRYRDYGSLVSLSKSGAVGTLMGNRMGTLRVEGWLARMFYVSLYRMHQRALYGTRRMLLRMLGDRLGRGTVPRLKLH